MIYYIISAAAGAAYGAAVGLAKYVILWRKMLSADNTQEFKDSSIVTRMIIGYAVNVAALLAVFFLRNIVPLDFFVTIIAAAVGLSLAGKFYSVHKIYSKVE